MDKISDLKIYLFGVICILLFHLPLLILKGDSYIIINDNLDCDFIYNHILKISNNIFNINQSQILDNIGENLRLSYIHSQFNFIKVFFLFFDSIDAYIYNSIIVRIIGFIFMFKVIKDCFKQDNFLASLFSFSFCLISTYTIYGISILGLPMVFWCFYNLLNDRKIFLSLILLFLFPAYSLIQFSSPFIIIYSVFACFYFYRFKKIKSNNFIFGTLVLFISMLLFNYNSFQTLFFEGDMKSARLIDQINSLPTFLGMGYNFIVTLFFDLRTITSFISIPIIILFFLKWKSLSKFSKIILLILVLNIIFQSVYPYLIALSKPIFSPFNFTRVVLLNVFLFYLILISLVKVYNRRVIVSLTIFITLINILKNPEFTYNSLGQILKPSSLHFIFSEDKVLKEKVFKGLMNSPAFEYHNKGFYTYNEFFSQKLFNKIKDSLGKDNYKIVNLGINPSVAQFNGFHTLDGYLVNYPISLARKFNKINKSSIKRNGLFLLSEELSKECGIYCYKSNSPFEIDNFNINVEELKKAKVKYLFSATNISEFRDYGLEFHGEFEDKDSPYKVIVYSL